MTAITSTERFTDADKLSTAISYAILALIAGSIALLRVGSWDVRLAMVSGDDSMEAVAIYFARAADFSADAYIRAWAPISMASAVSWVPALAYKYLAIHPRFFFEIFTIGQHVGLALAMFYLAFTVTRSQAKAWLTAAMTIAWNPQFWNLGLIASLEWMPYANWVALPFLVYAFAAAYRQQLLRSYLALLAGALIHPIMGVMATIIVGAFLASDVITSRDYRQLAKVAAASVAVAVLAAIPMILSTRGVTFATYDQTAGLLANPHVRPWALDFGIPSSLSSLLCLASFVALAHTRDRFFVSALVTICAMTAVHFIAVLLSIGSVMTMIASRSTILLSLICLPYVASTFWNAIESRDPGRILAIAITMFRANAITLLASALAIRGGRIGAIIGACLAAAVVASGRSSWHVMQLGSWAPFLLGYENSLSFSWIALAIGTAGAILATQRRTIAGAVLIVSSLMGSAWHGAIIKRIDNGTYADYAAAQIWARDNTPPDANFTLLKTIPQLSWRSLSERPVVAPQAVGTAYRQAQSADAYNARLSAFYKKAGKTYPDDTTDEVYWRAFAAEFGTKYLVMPSTWPTLAFTEAYRNSSFRIYRIN